MSYNSVRYNSSIVINNINEWPVDAHLMMAYRLSTWPVGWEKDDTVRFFNDFDSFHEVHTSYRDWAHGEDNAWRFALYVRENGVSLVLNPDAFIDGAPPITSPVPGSGPDMSAITTSPVPGSGPDMSAITSLKEMFARMGVSLALNQRNAFIDGAPPITSPVPGSGPDMSAITSFGRLRTIADMPVGPGHVDNPAGGCAYDDFLAETLKALENPDRGFTLRKTSSHALSGPTCSKKKVQNMFVKGVVRVFVSDNVCRVEGIPRQVSSGDVPFNAIAASPEFAAFVRSTSDEVVFVKRLVCATHVIDVAPVVADPYLPIELTLVCPLAWGLALYELDTIASLTVDELHDTVVVLDHD